MTFRSIAIRLKAAAKVFTSVHTYSGMFGIIQEGYSGAWQQNVIVDRTPATLLAFSAVYACVTGIASDIAKMRIKLTRNVGGIWTEIDSPHGNDRLIPVLKLLRRFNDYQTRIQFITCWILSKLLYGNAYVLKARDHDGNVVALHVLNPMLVTPLVAPDGSVYYSLSEDYLAEVAANRVAPVPASELIHDRMPELWHPLVGISPLYACAMSVTMGNKIQANSAAFFGNSSRPGGILTAPTEITQETADRLKAAWAENYSGANAGKIAVLGNDLKFEAIREAAEQAQLIEQLKWTVEDVGRSFHYPAFKLGGPLPAYANNVDALITGYYTDCLQTLIESLELCLDDGLGFPADIGCELDTDVLLRMDTAALYESNSKGINGGWLAPNEGRRRANLSPVAGGDSPMLQQQNYSLEALSKRDKQADPFAANSPAPTSTPAPAEPTPKKEAARENEEMTLRQRQIMRQSILKEVA